MALLPFLPRGGGNVWDPFYLDPFQSFGPVERTPARSFSRDVSAVASTRVDWRETAAEHIFQVDLPGLKKEEVKVEVEDGNVLKISGERSKEEVKETDKWHQVERSYGQFLRKFRLPGNVKLDQVAGAVENGVLTVTVPKVQPKKPESRTINIP